MSSPYQSSDLEIPALTTDQMREVDRLMVEHYQIGLIQMMEHAGRHLADLARERFLQEDPRGKAVLILAGSGGNGGGGLAAARHLHNWGAKVKVFTTRPPKEIQGVPGKQIKTLKQFKDLPLTQVNTDLDVLPPADLILDAVIGYSLHGAPQGSAARLLQLANAHSAPILSLDTPSGVDPSTGQVYIPHVQAQATLTLALPKQGLFQESTRHTVGELYLADISVPPELYKKLGVSVGPIFTGQSIIRLF